MAREITYHAIADWKRCRWRWYMANELCLEPIEKKPPMEIGDLWHKIMALYYRTPYEERDRGKLGLYIEEVIGELVGDEIDHILLSKAQDYREKLELMADGFYEEIGKDELFTMSVGESAVEESYVLKLSGEVYLVAHPDLVRIDGERLYLGEHKTGKDPDIEFYTMFDEQKYFYAYVISRVRKIKRVDCVYTICPIPTNKPPKVERISFPLGLDKIDEYGEEIADLVMEIGNLPLIPSRSLACGWDCQFYPICRTAFSGGDARYIAQTQYRVRDKKEGR